MALTDETHRGPRGQCDTDGTPFGGQVPHFLSIHSLTLGTQNSRRWFSWLCKGLQGAQIGDLGSSGFRLHAQL